MPKSNALKPYMRLWIRTSRLDEEERSSSVSKERGPGTHCIGGWIEPQIDLSVEAKRNNPAGNRILKIRSLY